MAAYRRVLGLLWVAAVLSGATCLAGIDEIDAEIDDLEAEISRLEARGDALTPDEASRLEALRQKRQEALREREDRRKRAEKAGNAAATILIGLGAILGVPALVGVAEAVRGSSKVPPRS